MAYKKIISDEEFMAWAESLKPCRYCQANFVGPVCPCERRSLPGSASSQFTLALLNKRSRRGV